MYAFFGVFYAVYVRVSFESMKLFIFAPPPFLVHLVYVVSLPLCI
jgi:hypothetical protein